MLHSLSEQVYIYNPNPQNDALIQQIADLHTFDTFSTNNIYQLHQYLQILPPKVMVFNIHDVQSLADLKSTLQNPPRNIPLIVVAAPSIEIDNHPAIAHYLPENKQSDLLDIVESYCMGNKKHDVMLLSLYSSPDYPLKRSFQDRHYRLFEVHNVDAALLYLSKNQPRIVCIEYTPQFIVARHTLQHSHIFYVDRQQDIDKKEKFLH